MLRIMESRGAKFITEPKEKYGEIRCYIRDPDGYIIEVGQSTDVNKADARPGWGADLRADTCGPKLYVIRIDAM